MYVKFGIQDISEPHDGEVGHVGEVSKGHKQVVLHTSGRSRPFLDIYILILKPYSYAYTVLITTTSRDRDLGRFNFDGSTSTRGSTSTGQLRWVNFDNLLLIGKQVS